MRQTLIKLLRLVLGLPLALFDAAFKPRYETFDGQLPEFDRYVIDGKFLAILPPKEAYVRWLHQHLKYDNQNLPQELLAQGIKHSMPTLAKVRQNANAYLVQSHEDIMNKDDMREIVEYDHVFYFKCELEQWVEDEGQWPTNLSLNTFKQWFDIEIIDMVLDTSRT